MTGRGGDPRGGPGGSGGQGDYGRGSRVSCFTDKIQPIDCFHQVSRRDQLSKPGDPGQYGPGPGGPGDPGYR